MAEVRPTVRSKVPAPGTWLPRYQTWIPSGKSLSHDKLYSFLQPHIHLEADFTDTEHQYIIGADIPVNILILWNCAYARRTLETLELHST